MVVERTRFRGYSGWARIAGGVVALAGGVILSSSFVSRDPAVHFLGWGVVAIVALLLNYGAVWWWFRSLCAEDREVQSLLPLADPVPCLLAGAIGTFALFREGAFDLLMGSWMVMYGLVNLSARFTQPSAIAGVGWFYMAAGSVLLLITPEGSFLHPMMMGLTFFVGELWGGLVFLRSRE